jgi:hypothetical protein
VTACAPNGQFTGLHNASASLAHSLRSGLTARNAKMNNGQFEFETRFQTWNAATQRHENGVTQEFFESSLALMQDFEGWKSVSIAREVRDYTYCIPMEDGTTKVVRTRVEFPLSHTDSTTGSDSTQGTSATSTVQPRVDHIAKLHIFTTDFDIYHTPKSVQANAPAYAPLPHRMRVCLNWEETVHRDLLPATVNPTYVRITHPCKFLYVNPSSSAPASASASSSSSSSAAAAAASAIPAPIWSYDFAKTWEGKTASEAEYNQQTIPPRYEIETECIDPLAYMRLGKGDESKLSQSILLKARDFFLYRSVPCADFSLQEHIKSHHSHRGH